MAKEKVIVCSSSAIEADWLESAGLHEYEDGVIVTRKDCQQCGINCCRNHPKHKSATPTTLPQRYKTLSW